MWRVFAKWALEVTVLSLVQLVNLYGLSHVHLWPLTMVESGQLNHPFHVFLNNQLCWLEIWGRRRGVTQHTVSAHRVDDNCVAVSGIQVCSANQQVGHRRHWVDLIVTGVHQGVGVGQVETLGDGVCPGACVQPTLLKVR